MQVDEIIERMVRECESSAQPAGLSVARRALIVPTATRRQILDITAGIRDLVTSTQISDGIALVNVLHTTCGLLLQGGDPARLDDLTSLLERLVPDNARYKHNDPRYSDCERGNGVAHLRAALIGQSVAMAIRSGGLALGASQSILLTEWDGPRERGVDVQVVGNIRRIGASNGR